MTTYSTGNPVGSPDPRDLYDNAENLDNAANADDATWTDRLGQPRRTMAGIEQDAVTAIQNAGYVGTGADNAIEDYAAGIEITQYNQIVRDTSGEFWRVSGSETLPYTLTGAGVPEGGALVSVGDAALRQDLVNGTADVTSRTGSQTLAEALDDRAGLLTSDLTVLIPTDYPTLQDAIDDLSKLRTTQGVTIDLMIESGHVPTSFISVDKGDYGHFTISSVDPVVTIGASSDDAFLYANNAVAPVLNCLIDGNSFLNRGCFYIDGTFALINPGCGVRNVRERGLYVGNSRVTASNCDFSGAGQDGGALGRCLWATRNADVVCEFADFTGCAGSSTSVYISRASTVHAAYATVEMLNGTHAVWLHRNSRYNAQESFIIGGNENGLNCTRGSTAVVNETAFTESGGSSITCSGGTVYASEGTTLSPAAGNSGSAINCSAGRVVFGGSTIANGFQGSILANVGGFVDASGSSLGTVTGTIGVHSRRGSTVVVTNSDVLTGAAPNDLRVNEGGLIYAADSNTTNSGGSGSPELSDTWVDGRGGFNALADNNGIIWV